MNPTLAMNPRILKAIADYGARLEILPDGDRPWTVAFIARLTYRTGSPVRASGRTPAEAIAKLGDLLDSKIL